MDTLLDGVIIIGGSLAVSLGGMWIVRNKVPRAVLVENHEVAGYMLSTVGALYAILLGLIVVNVQSKFEAANRMAVTEANCLSDLAHLSAIYSESSRKQIHKHLYDYAVAARSEDWSQVSTGQIKEATIPAYRALWISINKLEVEGSKQESAYSTMLSVMAELSDARRFRMVASHNGLSPILWAVLIIGELLIVWFTYFFSVENVKAQTIMTSFVVLFLSLNLLLVFLYDNPYRTDLGARNAGVTFHPEWLQDAPEPTAKVGSEARVGSEAKTENEPSEAKKELSKDESKSKSRSESELKTRSKSESKQKSKSKAESETKSESKPESKSESNTPTK
ncbi:MAG TPA: hypothetical protein V6C89_04695 [Drouetiella sp.]|jgi:Protein of unknown function (DUF4239)